ncbi:MAG: PQQ-binding-like beta-propeller repeat protein [Deltaproteobacteria bacterium]|nr:PQQ-binding-like beta-propeller repeat protein [Deltaproteobacteria bacterium]
MLSGDRVGLLGGNALWLLDAPSGRVVSKVLDASSQLGGGVLADSSGNFIFTTSRVFSVTPDGGVRWSLALGTNLARPQTTTSTSTFPLLTPGGVLLFAATDGQLRAVHVDDGGVLWSRSIGLSVTGRSQGLNEGIGDTFFVGATAWDVQSGVAVGTAPGARDAGLAPYACSYDGLCAGRYEIGTSGLWELRTAFLDFCGQFRWSTPTVGTRPLLFSNASGDLLGLGPTPAQAGWLSVDSGVVLKSGTIAGSPQALGADGTLYTVECSSTDWSTADLTVHAYDADLNERWSRVLGAPCRWVAPALGDDGVMYLARQGSLSIRVTALQTNSPGMAPTATATHMVNNRRTGWAGTR